MYKLETKDYPKVGKVVALCNVDDPRTVRAIVAVTGKEGQFDYAIDCGQLFDLNNKEAEGTVWVDDQFELDGEIGWRHASREEFNEMVDVVIDEIQKVVYDEFAYIVDSKQMRLYTFTDEKDFDKWIKERA